MLHLQHFPICSPSFNAPLFCFIHVFKFSFKLHPAVFVVQVKHPHTLSGESDSVGLGYVSAAQETALDFQAALKRTKKYMSCLKRGLHLKSIGLKKPTTLTQLKKEKLKMEIFMFPVSSTFW